jgi:serine/threonine protein kinase
MNIHAATVPIRKMTRSALVMAGPTRSTIKDLESFTSFEERFTKNKSLGRGADGVVCSYQDRTGFVVAVKTPNCSTYEVMASVNQEVQNLQAIGKHDNVASMLALCRDYRPLGPAIIFELCDLGDVNTYLETCFRQQVEVTGLPPRVPEITILKLLRDVVLGLDFLHNGNAQGFVHGDLKPGNILVCRPPGCATNELPDEPIFKITDLGRMSKYPQPEGHVPRNKGFHGTYEFAPPKAEQTEIIKPAIDIWALGAIIQYCALVTDPIQSRAALIEEREHDDERCPCPDIDNDDVWRTEYWRKCRPVVYRPINVQKRELFRNWDIGKKDLIYHHLHFYVPYSDTLQCWYKMLMDPDPVTRVSSAHLEKYVIPFVEQRIAIERNMALAKEGLYMANELREMAATSITGRNAGLGLPTGIKLVQYRYPSYEGNGY